MNPETLMNDRRLTFGVLLPAFIERAQRGELPAWLAEHFCGEPSEIARIIAKSGLLGAAEGELLGLAATLDHCLANEPSAPPSPTKERDRLMADVMRFRNGLRRPGAWRLFESDIQVVKAGETLGGTVFDLHFGPIHRMLQAAEEIIAKDAQRKTARPGRSESYLHAAVLALARIAERHCERPLSSSSLDRLARDLFDDVLIRNGHTSRADCEIAPRFRDIAEAIVPASRKKRRTLD